jgi:hypothetical protein
LSIPFSNISTTLGRLPVYCAVIGSLVLARKIPPGLRIKLANLLPRCTREFSHAHMRSAQHPVLAIEQAVVVSATLLGLVPIGGSRHIITPLKKAAHTANSVGKSLATDDIYARSYLLGVSGVQC